MLSQYLSWNNGIKKHETKLVSQIRKEREQKAIEQV
jgi:hypothetical protein